MRSHFSWRSESLVAISVLHSYIFVANSSIFIQESFLANCIANTHIWISVNSNCICEFLANISLAKIILVNLSLSFLFTTKSYSQIYS